MSRPDHPGKSVRSGLLIAASALILRMVYLIEVSGAGWVFTPILDAEYYHLWATELAAGAADPFRGIIMSPGVPLAASIFYRIAGAEIIFPIIFQFLLGSLTAFTVYLTARKIFSETAGIAAGIIYALHPVMIFYEGALLTPAYINFFNALTLYLIVSYLEGGGIIPAFLAAFSAGMSGIFRPTSLIFAAAALAAGIVSRRINFRTLLLLAAVAGVPFLLSGPLTGAGGLRLLPAGSAGVNFYIGNSPAADGGYRKALSETATPFSQYEDFRKAAEENRGKGTDYSASSLHWAKEGLRYIAENPAEWLSLMLRKLSYFFSYREIPTNLNFNILKRDSLILRSLFPAGFLIFPAGLSGLLIYMYSGRKYSGVYLLYLFSYLTALLIFFIASEHRAPVIPAFAVCAGVGAASVFKGGGLPAAGKILKYLILTGFLIALRFLLPSPDLNPHNAAAEFNLGLIFEEKGEYSKAAERLEAASEMIPYNPAVYARMGGVYLKMSEYDDALRSYLAALSLEPASAEYLNKLGFYYLNAGDLSKARGYIGEALGADPDMPQALVNASIISYLEGDFEGGLICARRALKEDGGVAEAYQAAALNLAALGHEERALENLRNSGFSSLKEAEDLLRDITQKIPD